MTYSSVRAETEHTRIFILRQLMDMPQVIDLWEDNSDLIVATFKNGQRVMFYLVDYLMSAHELQKTLRENSQQGIHTLFMFWTDMLLPNDGERFAPDDWMQSMLALYGDKIYGYDVSGSEVFIFPVYYDHQPGYNERYIRWGKTVNIRHLNLDFMNVESAFLRGHIRMADFDGNKSAQHKPGAKNGAEPSDDEEERAEIPRYPLRTAMAVYYERLNLDMDALPEDIRRAYRELARQNHPDLNPSEHATATMQEINQAYEHIMAQFDE